MSVTSARLHLHLLSSLKGNSWRAKKCNWREQLKNHFGMEINKPYISSLMLRCNQVEALYLYLYPAPRSFMTLAVLSFFSQNSVCHALIAVYCCICCTSILSILYYILHAILYYAVLCCSVLYHALISEHHVLYSPRPCPMSD